MMDTDLDKILNFMSGAKFPKGMQEIFSSRGFGKSGHLFVKNGIA